MVWTYAINHSVTDIPHTFYRSGSQATLLSKNNIKRDLKIFKSIPFFFWRNNAFNFFGQFKLSKKSFNS